MAKQPNFAATSFSLIGMLLPLLYFGGLIYYFSGFSGGSIQGLVDIGLGPTVLGLSALGLLFAIKPVMMLIRFIARAGSGSAQPARHGSAAAMAEDQPASDFNADDAIARYMAKRGATPAEADGFAAVRAEESPSAAPRPSFGRKAV